MAAAGASNAVVLLMLALLAGAAVGQFSREELDAVKETVRQLTITNPLWLELPEEGGCKQQTLELLTGCLEPVLPAVSPRLGEALNLVADIDNSGGTSSVVLDGGVILGVLEKDVLLARGCCGPNCRLASSGCGCNDIVFRNLVALLGNDEETARRLMERMAAECLADNPDMSFQSTLKGSDNCRAEFEQVASGFIC